MDEKNMLMSDSPSTLNATMFAVVKKALHDMRKPCLYKGDLGLEHLYYISAGAAGSAFGEGAGTV